MRRSLAALVSTLCVFVVLISVIDARQVCGTSFDDLPSRTLRAVVIFEGRVRQVRRVNDSTSTSSVNSPRHTVVFGVQKWLKGELRSASSANRLESVEVGYFDETGDGIACIAPLVQTGHTLLVFLASKSPSVTRAASSQSGVDANRSSRRRNAAHYPISSFPVKSTKSHMAIVVDYSNCTKCGRVPTVLLHRTNTEAVPDIAPTVFRAGQPLDLQCRIRRGRPPPSRIAWFKDGIPVASNKRIRLTQPSASSLSSKLVIKKAKEDDAGLYECLAENVLGKSERANLSVVVQSLVTPTKHHSVPCPDQGYCFNGGTCYMLETLGRRFCECDSNFQGGRCEEKHVVIIGRVESPHSKERVKEFEAILIICGVVIISLIIVVFSIVIFSTIRRKRKEKSKTPNGYQKIHKSPNTSAIVNITTTNAQREPDGAVVQLRNGQVHTTTIITTSKTDSSPERTYTSSIVRPVPSPHQSSSQQGSVCNQYIDSRARLRAVSGTPGSGSLLGDGTLSSDERDTAAGTVDRLVVPVPGHPPAAADRRSSGNAAVGVRSSGSCRRPAEGNQFFGDGDVVGLHRSVVVANEETRGDRSGCPTNTSPRDVGPGSPSVSIESQC